VTKETKEWKWGASAPSIPGEEKGIERYAMQLSNAKRTKQGRPRDGKQGGAVDREKGTFTQPGGLQVPRKKKGKDDNTECSLDLLREKIGHLRRERVTTTGEGRKAIRAERSARTREERVKTRALREDSAGVLKQSYLLE